MRTPATTAAAFLLFALAAVAAAAAADDQEPPKHYANAAGRILNDPRCLFNSEVVEEAVKQDVTQMRRQAHTEALTQVRTERQKKAAGIITLPCGETLKVGKPKKRYNQSRQVSPMTVYQAAMYQQGWQRANTPMVYGR